MERRSTNAAGRYVHFGGDVTAHAESSHGVRLSGGTTGGIVEAVGDDTNVTLTLRGQGTGGVVVGAAGQTVTVAGISANSTAITLVSGMAVRGAFSTTFAWTLPAQSSLRSTGEITLSTSVGDIMPGDLIGVSLGSHAESSAIYIADVRTSTAAASRVTIVVGNVMSTATSTTSGTGRITWLDLT